MRNGHAGDQKLEMAGLSSNPSIKINSHKNKKSFFK